jgi:hypothetical protein
LGTYGTRGTQGNAGPQGWMGTISTVVGTHGTRGPQGANGPQGWQGTRGDLGTHGERGTQGTKGPQGWQGTRGDLGTYGTRGTQGTKGVQGFQGTRGNRGTYGTRGTQGSAGLQGYTGTYGVVGSTGAFVTLTSTNAKLYLIGKVSTNNGWAGSFGFNSGVWTEGGLLYSSSDERLKNFHGDIDIDFDKLREVRKQYFTWKDNDKEMQIGTAAQDIQKLYPEIVSIDNDGHLAVSYERLSIIALSAIDKLYDRILELEEKFNDK